MTAAPSASSRKRQVFTRINYRKAMNKLTLIAVFLSSFNAATFARQTKETVTYKKAGDTIYPTNWWVGMHYSKPELMIHLKDIGNATSVTVSYPGVTLADWHRVENSNYLFLHLNISGAAKPGTLTLVIHPKGGGGTIQIPYQL